MSAPSMVEKYLRRRGLSDERVLKVMGKIPRHLFVPEALKERAYSDHPLPIGHDQTISQPYVVAVMTQTLKLTGGQRILEIGTGSGYQTAILAELARSVFSLERIQHLASKARQRIEDLGYHNVSIRVANGFFGWEEYAPYDGILVTAVSHTIPQALVTQLKEGGKLVIPLVSKDQTQKLFAIQKKNHKLETEDLGECSFVPLIS